MKEGGGNNPFPQGDKGTESEVVQSRKGSSGGVPSTPGDKEWISRGAGSGCEGFALRAPTGGLQVSELTRAGGYEVGGGSKGFERPGREAGPPGGQRERRPASAAVGSNPHAAGPRPQGRTGTGGLRGRFTRPKRGACRAPGRYPTW